MTHPAAPQSPPYRPPDWPTIVPRLFAEDVARMVEFLKAVFDARGEPRSGAPAEMRLGDSMLMVSEGVGPRQGRTAFLYVYVEDADAAYARALEAGARSVEAPLLTPYGDRRATVEDPWGNVWQIATRVAGA